MGKTAAASLEEGDEEEEGKPGMPAPIRFSRSKCDWLGNLQELQKQGTTSPAKQHCPGLNSTTIVAFGLPPGDFGHLPEVTGTERLQLQLSRCRKRKQERPSRSLPRCSSSLQHSPGGKMEKRTRRSWDLELQEDSANPNPPCRMQLTKRRDYGLEESRCCSDYYDEAEEKTSTKKAACSTPAWRSCMEKMKAINLRSDDSSQSDATLDCLNSELQHQEHIRDESGDEEEVEDQGPLLLQEKEKSHNQQQQESRATVFLQHQKNGFVADFHTRAALKLPPDHPACQPKDTLVYSLYQVFTKAGRAGLTPREAVSKILERKLPGLDDGGVISARVEVVKIVRNSPYFMELEESKFVLWSAITGNEDKTGKTPSKDRSSDSQAAQGGGMVHSWAVAAVRRARTAGKTRRKQVYSTGVVGCGIMEVQGKQEVQQESRKRRLKSVQQDCTGLGNRCNRSDGKGWHCPLRAQVGYLLCDHHLDRLRSKPGSKSGSKVRRKRGRGRLQEASPAAGKNELKRRTGGDSSWDALKAGRSSKRIKQQQQQRLIREEEEVDDLCGGEQEEVITTAFGLL